MFLSGFRLSVFISILSVFFGCSVKQAPVKLEPVQAFRSSGYVIQRLRPEESLSSLAETYYGDPEQVWRIHDENGFRSLGQGGWVVVPLGEKRRGGLYDDGFQGVPILCYHRFGNNRLSPMCISTKAFTDQMRYLKENGYRSISPEDLIDFLQYRKQLPRRSVMITFDDGYRSIFKIAYPILKHYGFTATFFIYTNYVGISSKAVTWDQLRKLKKEGFSIGAHSVAHSDLTVQADGESRGDYEKRLHLEIVESKNILDRKLSQNTLCFAYPFGRYNTKVMERVRRAGYKFAVTVERGNNPFFSNPLDLRRDMILKQDIKTFIKRLKTFNRVSLR